MKKFIKNTVNSIRANAIRLAATYRSGEGYIDTAVKILIAVVLGALLVNRDVCPTGDTVPHRTYERSMDGSPAQADL